MSGYDGREVAGHAERRILTDRNCDPGESRGVGPIGAETAPDIGELATRSSRICSCNLGNAELNQFWVRTTADVNPKPELGQAAREARGIAPVRVVDLTS